MIFLLQLWCFDSSFFLSFLWMDQLRLLLLDASLKLVNSIDITCINTVGRT
ncbi:hypothetical protein V6Z11_D09G150600 [Gossypium hirsutum]